VVKAVLGVLEAPEGHRPARVSVGPGLASDLARLNEVQAQLARRLLESLALPEPAGSDE
jgi:hypothetical protein